MTTDIFSSNSCTHETDRSSSVECMNQGCVSLFPKCKNWPWDHHWSHLICFQTKQNKEQTKTQFGYKDCAHLPKLAYCSLAPHPHHILVKQSEFENIMIYSRTFVSTGGHYDTFSLGGYVKVTVYTRFMAHEPTSLPIFKYRHTGSLP